MSGRAEERQPVNSRCRSDVTLLQATSTLTSDIPSPPTDLKNTVSSLPSVPNPPFPPLLQPRSRNDSEISIARKRALGSPNSTPSRRQKQEKEQDEEHDEEHDEDHDEVLCLDSEAIKMSGIETLTNESANDCVSSQEEAI